MTRIEPCAEPAAEAAESLAKLPDLGRALLISPALNSMVRELAILQVAVTFGCGYERGQHESVALDLDDPAGLAVVEASRGLHPR